MSGFDSISRIAAGPLSFQISSNDAPSYRARYVSTKRTVSGASSTKRSCIRRGVGMSVRRRYLKRRRKRQLPAGKRRQFLKPRKQRPELIGSQRLESVRERSRRIRMDLNNDAVRPCHNRSECHCSNEIPPACPVTRVDEYRKMRERFQEGDCVQVQRVPCIRFIRTNAPFTQDDIIVPAGGEILGRHEKFFNRCGK